MKNSINAIFIEIHFSCEKDNLEQTLRKIISKDFAKNDNKNQALFVSMKLLRGDLKQVS